MNGRITSINLDKGYGFLRGEDHLSRFFNSRDVIPKGLFETLTEGQRVTFEPIELEKKDLTKNNGLRAIAVTPSREPQ